MKRKIGKILSAEQKRAYDDSLENQGYLKSKERRERAAGTPLRVVKDSVGRIEVYQKQDGLMQIRNENLITQNQYDLALRLYNAFATFEARPSAMSLDLSGRDAAPDDGAEDVKDRARATIKHYMDYATTRYEKEALQWVEVLGNTTTQIKIDAKVRAKGDSLSQVLSKMERK